MTAISRLGANAQVIDSSTTIDPASLGGRALVLYAGDYATSASNPTGWDNPATNASNYEPWLNEIIKSVQRENEAAGENTEGVQVGSPSASTGTLGGQAANTTRYSVTVYGRIISDATTDADDIQV